MNPVMSLNLPEFRPQEPVAGEFYRHPYGGVGRDISVSREGFARFFEFELFELLEFGNYYGKCADRLEENHELIGYRGHRYGHDTWTITVIDRTYHGRIRYMEQEIKKIQQAHPDYEPSWVIGGVVI